MLGMLERYGRPGSVAMVFLVRPYLTRRISAALSVTPRIADDEDRGGAMGDRLRFGAAESNLMPRELMPRESDGADRDHVAPALVSRPHSMTNEALVNIDSFITGKL
ncbi:hypothetical protein SBC2_06180 [Caballeronia sp. SBC2]|nr:hypothetical protein SBC2_06180 [Caballeronia sp. SBC2]